jgi:phosphohistidine phosphatase
VANVLGSGPEQLVFDQRLYLAGPDDLLAVIREQTAGNLMLVGHNPGFTQLASLLSGVHIDNMPTCSYAEIAFEAPSWTDVREGMGRLLTFDWPKAKEPVLARP